LQLEIEEEEGKNEESKSPPKSKSSLLKKYRLGDESPR
jgi:hypothetical protein